MLKYLFSILLIFMFSNSSLANDINIQENIKLTFVCDLDKKMWAVLPAWESAPHG